MTKKVQKSSQVFAVDKKQETYYRQ